ncbi:hypothetical protein [Nocardia sp. NPDC058666]|uniref:DUF7373 family lipoprotein n=1 Tax=unclassified Nocardia TaxID=2637762 RepID=UPI00364C6D2A
MRIRHALLAATLTTVLTACGSAMTGTALPGETDIRALDTGSYPVEPLNAHDDDPVLPFSERYEVAALRLAEYVIDPSTIDPQMKYGTDAGTAWSTVVPYSMGMHDGMDAVAEKHTMLFGFESGSASVDKSIYSAFDWPSKQPDNKFTANITVLQFPDAARAAAAAQEFYDVDFGIQQGKSQQVALSVHPTAHAHWHPDSPFLRVFMPHGSYVIAVLLSVDSPDLAALTERTESALTKQIQALTATAPLTQEQILALPWDPDHVLMRTLNPDKSTSPDAAGGGYILTGKQGAVHFGTGGVLPSDRGYVDKQLTRMEAQQVGITNAAMVIRTPSADIADRALTEKLFPWPVRLDTDPAPKVPDTVCVENRRSEAVERFSCLVAYKQYVGIVSSDQLLDVHQRAAAQYALFANTR